MIGNTLGHYQITSQLGKGGMGEVFRAKDQKLGRDVAIKVLPEQFAKDADRIARFQREAKLLASLNHPNIAAIYGLEESGKTNFLVLELVEGDTLADQIKKGPIPVEESLKLALQIAEALEAAHEKGVIHRDLKPANIKVTPDGKVKVLDFGLAKAFAGEQENLNLSNSPTLSDAATQQGVILGTSAYMPPEQAKGKTVDKRADIWAFGVVLFEMLTGQQLFAGETVSETLASVLKTEPAWKLLPPNLHLRIRLLLQRCLKKEPKDRYGSISDGRVDIQDALADPSGVLVQPVTTVEPRTRFRAMLPWTAAALVLGTIITEITVWNLRTPKPRQVMHFEYELPEGQQFIGLRQRALAASPDGTRFVYGTTKGFYLRSVEELTAKLIPETGGTSSPFFSPDGQWIGYFSPADRKLKKINVNLGAPVALCDAGSFITGASWGTDDTIVYSTPGAIMRISAQGGTPETIIKAQLGMILNPQVLPGGESILYTSAGMPGQARIMVQPLKSGEPKELLAGSDARYTSTGHIIYLLDNNICAVPFDPGRLDVIGGSASIVQGVRQAAISDSGTLVYIPGPAMAAPPGPALSSLLWVDREGKEEPISIPPHAFGFPAISPDGTRVALRVRSNILATDVWIWDFVRKTLTRLTSEEIGVLSLLWTPDGKRIAISLHGGSKNGIFWKAADGTGEIELLWASKYHTAPSSWSPDGKMLFFDESNFGKDVLDRLGRGGIAITPSALTELRDRRMDIFTLSMKGERAKKPLLQGKYFESSPQTSPDGRFLAYVSNESGKEEIYVRTYPDVNGGKWPISAGGGTEPRWSPITRELIYRNGDAIIAVAVETASTFRVGSEKKLFRKTYLSSSSHMWDLSPDGKRFLAVKPLPSTGESPAVEAPGKIDIVVNWFEELKQKVPVK